MGASGPGGEKNRLTAADAQKVEETFQSRVASFATPAGEVPETAGQTGLTERAASYRMAKVSDAIRGDQ